MAIVEVAVVVVAVAVKIISELVTAVVAVVKGVVIVGVELLLCCMAAIGLSLMCERERQDGGDMTR